MEQDGGFNPDEGELPPVPKMVTLKTYLPVDATTEDRRNRIDVGVRLVAHVGPVSSLEERVLEEREWENSWKEHFDVLHVGKRTVICPTWREYESTDPKIVISLDPGMAFGTGHHPTTRMCLEQLERLVNPGMDVLDLGCGSGILSIAAAKLGAKRVDGLEVETVSVEAARENVRVNGVESNIQIVHGTLPHPDIQDEDYNIAVANISAKVVIEMAEDLVRAVRPGAKLVLSGILLENKNNVRRALDKAGVTLVGEVQDGDWVALVASKP